jgi:hypothetical protein
MDAHADRANSADALLSELGEDEQQSAPPRGARPPKLRYTHQAMADLVIENPGISQNQIAAAFGYTPAWVSTVFCSDAFKALLEQRRGEVIDPVLRMSLRERIEALTSQSLKILMEKLAQPSSNIPDATALAALQIGSKALGLGVAGPQVVITSEERLERLKGRLLALRGEKPGSGAAGGEVIDV